MRQFESHDIINEAAEPNKTRVFQIQGNHEFFVQMDLLELYQKLQSALQKNRISLPCTFTYLVNQLKHFHLFGQSTGDSVGDWRQCGRLETVLLCKQKNAILANHIINYFATLKHRKKKTFRFLKLT